MNKKRLKTLLISISVIISLLIIFFVCVYLKYDYYQKKYLNERLTKLNLTNYSNLMIVAHPDDEMLWGGSELINKNYVVVCVTCGSDSKRVKEFKKVMKETNDQYIMLDYPDKILFRRSNWRLVYKYIARDLKTIENYHNWHLILTHNKAGEYGHIQHKMVHKLVWDTANHDKVYVFGNYCSKKKMLSKSCSLTKQISESDLTTKKDILKLYKTQKHTIKVFSHMLSYEDVVKAVN